ncbi:MAG: hypothetical protein QG657_4734, partial [Acidobacteriota bacterium]|nr:hypothetical protein [Acidobacteriota bacterium]
DAIAQRDEVFKELAALTRRFRAICSVRPNPRIHPNPVKEMQKRKGIMVNCQLLIVNG